MVWKGSFLSTTAILPVCISHCRASSSCPAAAAWCNAVCPSQSTAVVEVKSPQKGGNKPPIHLFILVHQYPVTNAMLYDIQWRMNAEKAWFISTTYPQNNRATLHSEVDKNFISKCTCQQAATSNLGKCDKLFHQPQLPATTSRSYSHFGAFWDSHLISPPTTYQMTNQPININWRGYLGPRSV